MKRLLLLTLLAAVGLAVMAQTRVVDPDGQPLTGASVFDRGGTPFGIAGDDGILPEVPRSLYPITLHFLGFENTRVDAPTDIIVMQPQALSLGEVTVKPGDRPECHVVCFLRETAGMNNGIDTIRMVSEYMVDYMIPAEKGAKKLVTWELPRVLNSRVEIFTTKATPVEKEDVAMLTFFHVLAEIESHDVAFPDSLHGMKEGSWSKKSKKTGRDIGRARISPEQYTTFQDGLAEKADHKVSPAFFKLFGMTMDITELWCSRVFAYNPDERYTVRDLMAYSLSLKIFGRGRFFRLFFGDKNPVDFHSYVEVYPVQVEYLTREEAKELKKDKSPSVEFQIPAAAITPASTTE